MPTRVAKDSTSIITAPRCLHVWFPLPTVSELVVGNR